MTIGHYVRALRHERSMTQAQLAYKAGLSVATVKRIENGWHIPNEGTIFKLARAFNVDQRELLTVRERTIIDELESKAASA